MPFDARTEISDEALLIAFGNGDRAAALDLTTRLVPRVLGYATRLLGDRAEAEDVAQEAMLRLWRIAQRAVRSGWSVRQVEAKVTTWLYRVVTNLCTDRLRKRPWVNIDAVPEPPDTAASAQAGLEDAERQAALGAALLDLPERQRQAVVLRHIEGMTNPEIAEVMGIGIEAVESLTARGKRALAKALADRREDLGYGEN